MLSHSLRQERQRAASGRARTRIGSFMTSTRNGRQRTRFVERLDGTTDAFRLWPVSMTVVPMDRLSQPGTAVATCTTPFVKVVQHRATADRGRTQAEKLSTKIGPSCTLLHVCCTTPILGPSGGILASLKTSYELAFCERAADRDRTGMISLEG